MGALTAANTVAADAGGVVLLLGVDALGQHAHGLKAT